MRHRLTVLCFVLMLFFLTSCSEDSHLGEAKTPSGSRSQEGKPYQDVVAEFEAHGFTNIHTEPVEDLVFGLFAKEGEVEKVTVGGDEKYTSDSWIPNDTEVVIYFHVFPDKQHDKSDVKEQTTDNPPSSEEEPHSETDIPIEETPPIANPPSIEEEPPNEEAPIVQEIPPAEEEPTTNETPPVTEVPPAENTPAVEDAPPVVIEPDTSQDQPQSDTSDSKGSSVIVPDTSETIGNLVWVPTNGGKKYHTHASCSNMIDPIQVSIETATANGFTACKRCH